MHLYFINVFMHIGIAGEEGSFSVATGNFGDDEKKLLSQETSNNRKSPTGESCIVMWT